jgi:hypothetical protein
MMRSVGGTIKAALMRAAPARMADRYADRGGSCKPSLRFHRARNHAEIACKGTLHSSNGSRKSRSRPPSRYCAGGP